MNNSLAPGFAMQYPDWSAAIRNHYWHLRFAGLTTLQGRSRTRLEYRRIEAEKKRLLAAGIESELVRLLCRHLVNLANPNASCTWWSALSRFAHGGQP